MAVPLPPPGTVQVAISGSFGPARWSCIFHGREETPSASSESQLNSAAQNYWDAWATAWIPFQSDQVVLERVDVIHWGAAGAELIGGYFNVVPGEDSGVTLDASCALVVSERIASHYKGGHPRYYVCGLAQDRLEDPTRFSGATVDEAQSAAESFLTLFNGVTLGAGNHTLLACLRRFANGGSLTVPKTYLDPPTLHDVTSVLARAHVGSQRRRLGAF